MLSNTWQNCRTAIHPIHDIVRDYWSTSCIHIWRRVGTNRKIGKFKIFLWIQTRQNWYLNGTKTKRKKISWDTKSALRRLKQCSMILFWLTFPDEYHSENEERFTSIGISSHNRVLLVVHTKHIKAEKIIIRIISCRKASERKIYEEWR